MGYLGLRWPSSLRINLNALSSIFYGNSGGIDENVFSANLKRVAIHPYCRVLADFAAGHVVLPAVPWARDSLPVHDPLAQRPAPVQAGIVDGVKLAPHIRQGNCFALDLKFSNRTRPDLILLCFSRT